MECAIISSSIYSTAALYRNYYYNIDIVTTNIYFIYIIYILLDLLCYYIRRVQQATIIIIVHK